MKAVEESGMYFGDYPDENFFYIENSQLQQSVGEGIKTVEFILLQNENKCLFVEAKTTCPNAANKGESNKKREKFEEYYQDISEKFLDSLQMYLSVLLNKSSQKEDIGSNLLDKSDYSEIEICFVLVIKDAKDISWLAGPKAELDERLKKIRQIWKAKVIVLNHDMAEKYGLVKQSNT